MPRERRLRHHQSRGDLIHLGYGYNNCTTRFLEQFAEAQAQKRPPVQRLTNQEHEALRKHAGLAVSMRPALASNTKPNIAGILSKWERYCQTSGIKDADRELRTAVRPTRSSREAPAGSIFGSGNSCITMWSDGR